MAMYNNEIFDILRYKELLRNLVMRDIKVRYKRSVLGFLWVMLNPLFMMLILNMVFSEIFKVATKNYTSYLLSGIILWNFFSQSTSSALKSLLTNSNLIKKIYLPKAIFPLSVVMSAVVNFVFSLVPLFLIFYLTGTPMHGHIVMLPLVVIMAGLFCVGVSLILSTLTVFFHDTIYIYEVGLLAWMYMTPVFFPESIVPEKFRIIFQLNPMYYFISIFRGVLYMDVPFFYEKLLYAFLCSLVALSAGWFIYDRYKDRVVYHL
ncbi:MAG: ABC transporter permease [Thermodesulfovibrionales bacterium]